MTNDPHNQREPFAGGDIRSRETTADRQQPSRFRWLRLVRWFIGVLLIGGVAFALLATWNRLTEKRSPRDAGRVMTHTETPRVIDIPVGLPEVEAPPENPTTEEKVALGRRLFFDADLSLDRSISCASCHDPEKGWTNGEQFAVGVGGATGTRNTPTILNAAYNRRQFWDGRVRTLEAQALGPIMNPVEMAMPSPEALVDRIREDPEYEELFAAAFPDGITAANVGRALAAFQRTVLAGNTPYDRFQAGDREALSPAARNGLDVFLKKGNCANCHKPPLFTDHLFYNLGVGMEKEDPDVGFYAVTELPTSVGRFKTPTVREVAKTAPYMHDGSISTIAEVVDFYDKGGQPNPNLDRGMRPLRLTDQEKRDLVQFMVEGLSSNTVEGNTAN